jgi:hypothetical protein
VKFHGRFIFSWSSSPVRAYFTQEASQRNKKTFRAPTGGIDPSNRAPEAEPEERSDIMAKSADTKKESKKKPTKTQKEKKAAKKSKKETQGS